MDRFIPLITRLLTSVRWRIGGKPHRIVEVELYHHAADHPDPFVHNAEVQHTSDRWYFHRTGGVYRGGSFKGLDLSIGGDGSHGGILIRGIETPDGTHIDGPSRTVDHILKETKFASVAVLDAAINGRSVWDATQPIPLTDGPPDPRDIFRCARVGLTLKKTKTVGQAWGHVFRAYRFLTEPKRIKKGKLHMALAELAAGKTPEEVAKRLGSPVGTVRQYAEAFEAGKRETDPLPFHGRDWTPAELCRAFGVWWGLTHPSS